MKIRGLKVKGHRLACNPPVALEIQSPVRRLDGAGYDDQSKRYE